MSQRPSLKKQDPVIEALFQKARKEITEIEQRISLEKDRRDKARKEVELCCVEIEQLRKELVEAQQTLRNLKYDVRYGVK